MLLEAMEIESKLAHRFSVSAYVHLMPEPNGHLKHIGGYDTSRLHCKEPRYRITGPNKTQSAAGCVRFCEIVEELTA